MRMNQSPSHDSPKKHWKKLFAVRKFLNLAHKQSTQSPAQELIFNKFYVGKKIANGSFGQIRLGAWIQNKKTVAIKLEHEQAKIPMLSFEYQLYQSLLNEVGFPKIYDYGSFGKYNALVMELLGPNLEELFLACNRSFSISTILQIGIQLVTRMEAIHSHGIIYRDVKPDNFLVGHSSQSKSNLIHVVDFGLAKKYIDPLTSRHISYSENKFITGTVRYMSINAHLGKEQSRRDDMEALSHVFFYFLTKGNLPWQGTPCGNVLAKYKTIRLIKEETSAIKFGSEFPWEFTVFLKYCRSLHFTQSPNYNYLRNLFRNCLKRLDLQENYIFDWMIPVDGSNNSQRTLVLQTENEQIGKGEFLQSFKGDTNSIQTPFKSSVNASKKTSPMGLQNVDPGKSFSTSHSRSLPSSIHKCFKVQKSIRSAKSPSKKSSHLIHQQIKYQQHQYQLDGDTEEALKNLPGSVPDFEYPVSPKLEALPIPQINIELCSDSELSKEASSGSLSSGDHNSSSSAKENQENSRLPTRPVTSISSTHKDSSPVPSNRSPSSLKNKKTSPTPSHPKALQRVSFSSSHLVVPKVFQSHSGLTPPYSKGSNVPKDNESNYEKHVSYFMCCPFVSLWS